eukprot:gene20863-32572_t
MAQFQPGKSGAASAEAKSDQMKLLKQTKASLWVRNIQLAVWSLLVGLAGVAYNDGEAVSKGGFLQGYNFTVWCVVLLQAASGIIVAIVIKYADNIVKNFSVAMSLLLATVISIPLFGFHPTVWFVGGAMLVLVSVHLYTGGWVPGLPSSPKAVPIRTPAQAGPRRSVGAWALVAVAACSLVGLGSLLFPAGRQPRDWDAAERTLSPPR